MYHLDKDGTLLGRHTESKVPPAIEDAVAADAAAASGNSTVELFSTAALNAASFDYVHRTHPAGLFALFCIAKNRNCQA